MRPHRLRFAGIGPYAGLVEIDFDDLAGLGLYLIVGPTGAGKTTIFDAITFALYGKVAGDRPVAGLVSDHAHRVAPFVELDFSHRGGHYRAHRTPAVAGKAGKPNDQYLRAYTDEGYGTELRTVTGATNVSDEVAALIGLDAAQFLRVMLLPQNEFQQFLLANSTDKEKLLRVLFGTQLYEQIAKKMVDAAEGLYANAKAKEQELDVRRGMVRQTLQRLIDQGYLEGPEDPESGIDSVADSLMAALAVQVASAEVERTRADDAAKVTLRAHTSGEADAKRFDAAAARAGIRSEHDALAPEVARAVASLDLDARARRVVVALVARDAAAAAESRAIDDVARARAVLAGHVASFTEDVPVLVDIRALTSAADVAAVALKSEIATARNVVEAAVKELDRAERSEREAAGKAEEVAARRADLFAWETDLAGVVADRAVEQGLLDVAKVDAARLPALTGRLQTLDAALADADVAGARTALLVAQTAADRCNDAFDAAQSILDAARLARTRHLAGELALTLVDGRACPVCGSTDHPAKAALSASADVGELEAERDKAHEAKIGAESQLGSAQNEVERREAKVAALPPGPEQQQLRDDHAAASVAASTLSGSEATVTGLASREGELRLAVTKATAQAESAGDEAARLLAQAAEDRAGVARVIDPLLVEPVQEFLVALAELVDGLLGVEHAFAGVVGQRREAASSVARALADERVADEAAARAGVSDDAMISTCRDMIKAAHEREAELARLDGVVGADAVPVGRPDVDALKAIADEASQRRQEVAGRYEALNYAAQDLEESRRQLAELGPGVQHLVDRAKRAYEIADVVSKGKAALLGLERWVQRAIFEEVCEVASDQMQRLSQGRYVLTLEANGAKAANRTIGLDIFITDGHTGVTRPVQSLSGGEKFLTSLALALALAEVVQSRSGGIELSTLFIDEGFGSLDGDTLDTATEVLRSLQDSGRTVGVISHVEAMRQELSTGIVVRPSPAGSTVVVRPDR